MKKRKKERKREREDNKAKILEIDAENKVKTISNRKILCVPISF